MIRNRAAIWVLLASLAAALAACSGLRGLSPATPGLSDTALRHGRAPVCSSYTPYSAGNGTGPVVFADKSGIPETSYVYVVNGPQTQYLGTDGAMHSFPAAGATPTNAFFPLSCFTKANEGFMLPPGNGNRVYISYGTLVVNGLTNTPGPVPACCEKPNIVPGFTNPNYNILWDFLEYTYPSGNGVFLNTSQVDSFGLPLELSVTASGKTTTAGTKSYCKINDLFTSSSPWDKLIIFGHKGGAKFPLRVMSPKDATTAVGNTVYNPSFPQSYFAAYIKTLLAYYKDAGMKGNPNYHKITMAPYQYLTYAGAACNEAKTGAGGSTVCPEYYASSDGKANFIFTLATSPTPPPNPTPTATPIAFPKTITVPISQLTSTDIWSQPLGGSSLQFYAWKALSTDILRGVAQQGGLHPVAPCTSKKAASCSTYFATSGLPGGLNYYQDPNWSSGAKELFSGYAGILHDEFLDNFAYATTYDDMFGQASVAATGTPASQIGVTVESMDCPAR